MTRVPDVIYRLLPEPHRRVLLAGIDPWIEQYRADCANAVQRADFHGAALAVGALLAIDELKNALEGAFDEEDQGR